MEIGLQVLLLATGFLLLVKGADWFVDGAAGLAERLHIPQLIIGLTIVAMGTSLPEAAVSISAAVKGNADITIGNVVGSNILNILIILGLSAAVTPLNVQVSTIRYELPLLIFATALVFVQGLDGVISSVDGILQLLLFAAYLVYLVLMAKRNRDGQASIPEAPLAAAEQTDRRSPRLQKEKPWLLFLFFAALGLVMIVAGSSVTVKAASSIARIFGISERFIGLTIVALGTSLPELFTSVTAARKGNADIAIGNIVGSNIFNLLFVIGVSALVIPVPYAAAFQYDNLIAQAAALLLFLCCVKRRKLLRRHGILMLFGYAAYFMTFL